MAKKKLTVFQTLERALKGDFTSDQGGAPHINSYDMSGANSVIYRTKDKEDFEKSKNKANNKKEIQNEENPLKYHKK